MHKYILRRLVTTLITLFGVSLVVFTLMRVIPGSIINTQLGIFVERTPELVAKIEATYGLDQPFHVQYIRWIGDMLRGDLGTSWRSSLPVIDLIKQSLPVTLELTFLAMLITMLLGVPLGVISAVRQNGMFDNIGRLLSFAALGLPDFWQGAMMLLIASVGFKWFPPLSFTGLLENPGQNLAVLALPAIALGTGRVANVMRLTRSSILEEMPKDYIRTARSKGLQENAVILRHAFRNSLISIITILGLMMGYLFGGAVTVEAVFSLPGLGRLILTAIQQRDYPVAQATLLLSSALFILINFLVDVLYAYVNPQIHYE